MKHQLQYFQITMFAIVMGLAGLTIVFHRFSEMGVMPTVFFEANLAIVTALFLFFSVT